MIIQKIINRNNLDGKSLAFIEFIRCKNWSMKAKHRLKNIARNLGIFRKHTINASKRSGSVFTGKSYKVFRCKQFCNHVTFCQLSIEVTSYNIGVKTIKNSS